MENTKILSYREKLAKLILSLVIIAISITFAYFFSDILFYIAMALVVSLLSRPIMNLLEKVKIGKFTIPVALCVILSIIIILGILTCVVAILIPVFGNVVADISRITSGDGIADLSGTLANFDEFVKRKFPVSDDFKAEAIILSGLKSSVDMSIFGNLIGSVASTIVSLLIGLISVFFISFFFIKDEYLLKKAILAMTPDHMMQKLSKSIDEAKHLLSRYFVGLLIEMSCVGFIDFLGLWSVARLDVESALGIGFFAALMNIIPYVGPLLGGVFGSIMAIIIKYGGVGTAGLNLSFWAFIGILACIFLVAKLVDDFLLQPLIYSTSIKAHPLEIFLVLLIAGTVGGVIGMLIAIPSYTVIRVIALHFFPEVKFVKFLINEQK